MKSYERILLIAPTDMRRSPAMRQAALLARDCGAVLHLLLADHSVALELVGRLRRDDAARLHESFLRERRDWLEREAEDLRAGGLTVTTEAVWTKRPAEEIVLHAVEWQADLVVKDVQLGPVTRRLVATPVDRMLLRRCPAPLLMVNSEHLSPRRIVVAADVTLGPADPLNVRIVEHALALSYATGAELHLAYAFQVVAPIDATTPMLATAISGDVYESLYRVHRESFDAFAAAFGVPQDRQHFLDGPAALALSDFAAESSSDVIVMGTTHRSRFERVLMGSTAEAMLEHLPCNVLAIKSPGMAAALADQAHPDMSVAG